MQIYTEEKKEAFCAHGVLRASFRVLYPRAEGKEKINAFYSEIAENLAVFFREKSRARAEEAASLPRREKMGLPPLCMNMFFSVAYCDEKIISIVREYVLSEGKTFLAYRKSGEIWCAEKEILLPAKKFFPHKLWKKAEKNEFYFDGEAVIIENLFPESRGGGRRVRLSDYIIETRAKK
jgi:hypothetical protein